MWLHLADWGFEVIDMLHLIQVSLIQLMVFDSLCNLRSLYVPSHYQLGNWAGLMGHLQHVMYNPLNNGMDHTACY